MPSKFWQSLKKLRVPSRKKSSESGSSLENEPLQRPPVPQRPRVRIGVRRNPDLVGVEYQFRARKQVQAMDLLLTLKEMEAEFPPEVTANPFMLEYTTLQFVKTILMRVSEGIPVTSCWAKQVEDVLCQTELEKTNFREAVNWVKLMMEDQLD
ncbi:accessory protein [meleucus virus]|uniref:Accessory protein n=1 Tax=meleucus virus TaxID=2940994 RepID=A0AAE9HV47_9MONO|nr:accessory protein [meleucus virus]